MSDMDRTRPDVSDTQPLPVRSPAPEATRHDPPSPGERPRTGSSGQATSYDVPPGGGQRPGSQDETDAGRTRQDLSPGRSRRAGWPRTGRPQARPSPSSSTRAGRDQTGSSWAGPTRNDPTDDEAFWAHPRDDPSWTDRSWTDPSPTADPGTGPARGAVARPDQVTLRFGPGVPAEVARIWRDGAKPRRPMSRRVAGGVLTLAVALLAALAVWWLLRGGGPAVQVTGVSVRVPTTVQHCDTTVQVVGTIRTNGGRGDVSYRWRRSDGQVSGVFTETLGKGQRSVRVPLRWTIKGTGTLHAVATLEVVAPTAPAGRASAGFLYACG